MIIFITFSQNIFTQKWFSRKCNFILENGFRENSYSANCTIWKVSILENRFSGEMSIRAKCTFWKVYVQGNVFLESVFQWNVFLGSVRIPSLSIKSTVILTFKNKILIFKITVFGWSDLWSSRSLFLDDLILIFNITERCDLAHFCCLLVMAIHWQIKDELL